MTKSIKLLAVLSLTLFITAPVIAQKSCSSSRETKNIQLDGTSKTEEIQLEVTKDLTCLNIGLNSTIENGSLTVEIFDPKGDKQGNFSVERQMSSNSSSSGKSKDIVCGQLNKNIQEPMKGKWTVKLKPKNATGDVTIISSMSYTSN